MAKLQAEAPGDLNVPVRGARVSPLGLPSSQSSCGYLHAQASAELGMEVEAGSLSTPPQVTLLPLLAETLIWTEAKGLLLPTQGKTSLTEANT